MEKMNKHESFTSKKLQAEMLSVRKNNCSDTAASRSACTCGVKQAFDCPHMLSFIVIIFFSSVSLSFSHHLSFSHPFQGVK